MSMSDRDGVIWFDGQLVPWREANVHVLTHGLHYASSVFEGYIGQGMFSEPSLPFDPAQAIKRGSWGEIHGDEITGDVPGALYNASYAIDLASVPRAVPVIRKAVAGLSPSFLFTLRFLKNPAGNLAFTRFPDCAVIEIDGLSPLICEIVLEVFRKLGPVDPRLSLVLICRSAGGQRYQFPPKDCRRFGETIQRRPL